MKSWTTHMLLNGMVVKTVYISLWLHQLPMRQPARSYTSVSLLSDGSGPVEMSPLGQLGGDGRVKRVSASIASTIHSIFFLIATVPEVNFCFNHVYFLLNRSRLFSRTPARTKKNTIVKQCVQGQAVARGAEGTSAGCDKTRNYSEQPLL